MQKACDSHKQTLQKLIIGQNLAYYNQTLQIYILLNSGQNTPLEKDFKNMDSTS